MSTEKKKTSREYPPIYEKTVPVLVGILAVAVIGMIIAAVGVLLGFVG